VVIVMEELVVIARRPPVTLDEDGVGSIDHDLPDVVVGEERLEGIGDRGRLAVVRRWFSGALAAPLVSGITWLSSHEADTESGRHQGDRMTP
jgi:hypothetical protein